MSVRRLAALVLASLAASAGAAVVSAPARAEFTVTFAQVGNAVVATGSGTINLTGLTDEGSIPDLTAEVIPTFGAVVLGTDAIAEIYSGISGPSAIGGGATTSASSATGSIFALNNLGAGEFSVPQGYVSGSQLSDSATFSSATIASLGLTPGTYIYTWDTSAPLLESAVTSAIATDSIQVVVPNAALPIPEPTSLALLALPVLVIAASKRRRGPKPAME